MRGRWDRYVCAVTVALVVVVAGLAVAPSFAVVPPQDDPLREQELRHPDLWYKNVFRPVAELPIGVSRQLGPELSRLGVDPGNAFFDLRTGRWGTLILVEPLIPGSGVGNDLQWTTLRHEAPPEGEALEQAVWEAFRTYLSEHAAELRIDPEELAEPTVTVIGDRLIQIHVGRAIDGIPVRDTFVKAALNSGNLVLWGQRNWANVELSLAPRVTSEQAEGVVRQHVEGFPFARLHEQPHLELIPVSDQPEEADTFLGSGLEYRLAWVLRPYFEDHEGSWEALVDAHSGELLSFVDTNHYASRRVEGWIYPVSNDGEGDDGTLQPGFPMPFADLALDGTDVGFTTTGGNVPTGLDPGTILTTLSGEFMRMNDSCGAIDESAEAGDLDLEGIVGGTDCAVPPGHSSGDTNSSRTGFYELNRLAEQARGYLPDNTWLQQQLTANMNLPQTCNAFWNGTTVNFFRSAIPQGCRNTGEIAGVFDHEWGHGMDDNDGNPSISNPGEGIADIFAHNRLNTSCIGRGFFTDSVCGGYGDPCIPGGCTGIRDIDYEQRVSGQPHDIAWIDANCSGGPAPCGGIVHCEGAVYAEAVYDLVHRDLMGFEGSPFDLDLNTALEIGTRLTFYGSSNVGNWYQCTTDGTGGCNSDSGYLGYLAADDDNGDLTDGTPHMSAIFAAFERHQISCNAPAVQDSGCAGGPTEAPANVATVPFDEGVELSWDPVAGASEYWIFQTEGVHGCDFGKSLVGKTTDTTFSETGLRNDFEVSYGVVAVGASDACTSPMSQCLSVSPTAGPSGFIEGTVTDAGSSSPIEGAIVEAAGPVTVADLTDAAGFYRVQVPVGTYDVTADADAYDPQTVSGVEVLENETVTLDFALNLTPRPIVDISPDSFEFVLNDGEVGTDTMTIGNLGDLDLEWSITTDVPDITTTPNALNHDPALDEPLDVPDFTVDSPANGGSPQTFTIPAGVLTRGEVVGFSFIGTVAGITGNGSWASDMCMIIEAPDGATYAVGGFTGTQAGCAVNPWDFDGSGSDPDGTYESMHDNVFPGVDDEGQWTLTFINDWDSTGAGTMDWTDVTVTLHKRPLPVCDGVTDVPWLSAVPDSGTTAPGATDEVTVTVDSTAAGLGNHEAGLCVATNDPDAPVVPVLVSLTVVGDGDEPVIDVDPDSLSSTLQEGQSETQPLTISNLGVLDLDWQVAETGPIVGGGQGLARAAMPQAARRSAAAGGSFDAVRRTAIDVNGRAAMDLASVLGEPLSSLRVVNPQNGVVDCDGEPGIIIHDDGTVENGYTGDPATINEVRFVDLFTPSAYPATFNSVCVAFISLDPPSLDFELVVFDDDGTDGAPGTELGSLAVSADGIPNTPGAPTWFSYDISSLGITIDEGSVYIGARWSPMDAGLVFMAADESTANPPGFAGGYWWNSTDAVWIPTEDPDLGFEEYRSLMVRAVAGAVGGGDCALPTWVSVTPTSGTVPGGGSQVADVTFDATGLDPGDYSANLCLASNDPVTPLVMVPLSLTVEGGGGVPTADISPDSFTFEVPAGGSDSDTLNVGNTGTADLVWSIDEAENPPTLLEEWSDDFDSYATGSQLHGQGGWKGWLNDPAAGALTSDAQAQSTPNSAEIVGASDLVREYVDSTSGQWTYTAWHFIPTDFSGTSMFIMLNTYNDGGSGLNWSVQVEFRSATDSVVNAGASGGTLPLIRGEWVELRVEIDLDADTQDFFYNGELLYSGTWTNEVSGGGALNIGVVDLFANGATPVYYDDLSLSAPGGGGSCASPTDVPWLSATPASGTTAPGSSEPVDVAVDASALDPGDYSAQLCVNTNDPDAPLVEVPVSLTVTPPGDDPVIDVDPDSLGSTLPTGGTETQPLTIANIGGGTLDWQVTEDGGLAGRRGALALAGKSGTYFPPDRESQRAAAGRGDGAARSWSDPGLVPGDAGGAVSNTFTNLGSLTFYEDRGDFQAANPGLPLEDFADTNVPPNSVVTCAPPFNSDTNDDCFSPGDIEPGLSMDVTPAGGSELGVVLTPPFAGVSCVSVGPNSFVDHADWDFDPPVHAAGFDMQTNAAGEVFTLEIFGPAGSLGTMDVTVGGLGTPTFFGVDTSDTEGISRIEVRASGDLGELFCDVEFGGGMGSPDCTLPDWASVDPTSGSLPGGESQVADVTFDATGLDPDTYETNLCLASNDPTTPLVVVPLTLTVEGGGGGPIADITPDAFTFEVPTGGSDTQTLNVGNIGDADLTWSIDEAETAIVVPEGAPYRYGLAEMPEFHAPVGHDRASGITRSRGEAPADPIVLPAPQQVAIGELDEGFDDITQLPGAGWAMINNSEPTGPSSWFQGNETIFPSHEGAPDAYIAANFESTDGAGDISNWLITPEVTIVNGTQITFWTRTSEQFEEFFDRLEVRMSVAGDSTDVGDTAESVGDFAELLLTINPDLGPGEYPEEWTQYVLTVRERSREPVTGRFAFRYWVTDSGPDGTNGDYIGIDTVSVTQPDGMPPGGCDNPADIPWLSADPTSGTTAPGGSEPVNVMVDASALDPGDYAAQLCVNTNDPDAPIVPVPVSLTVTAGDLACFAAALDGDQETPPVPTDHTGVGAFTYDFDTQELTWEVSHDIDLAEVVGAHIHVGAIGEPGPIDIPLDHTMNPIVGSATLTPEQEGNLTGELYYVNIHTNAYPGGEIRGQILPCAGGGDSEPLDIGDFDVVSPANGGEPVVITVPGGVVNPGDVTGFSFIGTAAGISGNSGWASDTCMIVEAPDGATFSVGGISGTDPACAVNDWDFQGGDSTDDGTYESTHDDVFPAVEDEGDWTFTFINDWDSTSAPTISWTDVTVTLHKTAQTFRDDI